MEGSRKAGWRAALLEELYATCAFCVAVAALPALAASYLVVRISKNLWLRLLSSRYPQLQFIRTDTVRSLLDTHRNQGIINVLLCVRGPLNVDEVKQHITDHVLDRRDNHGGAMFPRMRHALVSCWGNYAWDQRVPFNVDNHVLVAGAVHRGRPVADTNVQDYVSEIVSKYFPTDQSPWQYIIIPYQSTEPKYYILVRVHHLLMTGKKSINIGDLLLVEQKKTSQMIMHNQELHQQSPLIKLFPTPSAIPELFEKINEMMSNAWNEFVSEYDPVESPRALKTLPGVFHIAGLVLMSTVSALRELTKKRYNGKDSMSEFTPTALLAGIQRECYRRNLTIPKLVISPLVTIDPRKWPRAIISTTYTTLRTILRLPLTIREEILALRDLNKSGQVYYTNTYTWKYAGLAQLAVRAGSEAWRGMVAAYRAPAKLWTDTIRSDDGQRHALQTVSLCGRKVAAWSKPVSRAGIDRAARALGVSSTDLSLFAATEGLRAYFEQTHNTPPEVVLTTARAATEDFLFTFAEGDGKKIKKSQTGGMVCLTLPVGASPRRIAAVVQSACQRQGALAAAWTAQARYGTLTRAVPSPLARLTLNLLSRRYAVSYAEILAPAATRARAMQWGQALDHVLYWRPPQANISMSLTVIQYADTVRIAVMTDSRLAPGHTIPATRWATALDQLINKVDQEIARISAQSIPAIVETTAEATATETVEEEVKDESKSMLQPPAVEAVSPPPARRRIA
ncbi:uncharacterized protein LOC105380624 [Plutella xylostella]|uniref:uncharacterized protein LOC105380624 n=1 Tax=Plutella xylostella TaxID=51655 RepID=UPI002032985D|nr:uncharacterized protein LOC105380624 [Plutella xylostella]